MWYLNIIIEKKKFINMKDLDSGTETPNNYG